MEVDYVMVLFGGYTGFSGDDMNKFSWILRIAGNVYPNIKRSEYMKGNLNIGDDMPPKLRESVMYKLCYYKFWETYN